MTEQVENNALGNFIRSRLKELQLSQVAIAQKVGVNPSVISRIVTGRIEKPRDATLSSLAEVLQVSVDNLVNLRPHKESLKKVACILVPENIWALCVILEQVEGKSIEDILLERLRLSLGGSK